MTHKPSGIMQKRKRRRERARLRAQRCARLRFDIDLLERLIEQSEPREQVRLTVKLRLLRQRLRYISV